MRKYLLIIILLFCPALCTATLSISDHQYLDQLFDQAVQELSDSFYEIPSEKTSRFSNRSIEGIAILPLEGDIEEKFYSRFRSTLTRSRFFLYERNEIERILSNQGIQQADYYSKEGRLRIGELTQWKGIVFGKINAYTENLLGKKQIYLEVSLDFDNLETGQVIWNEHRTYSAKKKYSLLVYPVVVLALLVLIFLLNWATRGRKVSVVTISGILAIISFSIWFFVI